MTRRGDRTPIGGGYATARAATGREHGRPSETDAPRFGGPDAAAPGQRRTEPMRGAPPFAPAPKNGRQHPSAFKRRLRHRPTPRPLAGPGAVCGARTAGKDGAPAFVGPGRAARPGGVRGAAFWRRCGGRWRCRARHPGPWPRAGNRRWVPNGKARRLRHRGAGGARHSCRAPGTDSGISTRPGVRPGPVGAVRCGRNEK